MRRRLCERSEAIQSGATLPGGPAALGCFAPLAKTGEAARANRRHSLSSLEITP